MNADALHGTKGVSHETSFSGHFLTPPSFPCSHAVSLQHVLVPSTPPPPPIIGLPGRSSTAEIRSPSRCLTSMFLLPVRRNVGQLRFKSTGCCCTNFSPLHPALPPPCSRLAPPPAFLHSCTSINICTKYTVRMGSTRLRGGLLTSLPVQYSSTVDEIQP